MITLILMSAMKMIWFIFRETAHFNNISEEVNSGPSEKKIIKNIRRFINQYQNK